MKKGSLTIVGTGIRILSQVTREARESIEKAEQLLYAADAVTAHWLKSINPTAEPLDQLYQPGKPRSDTYEAMVERILYFVRKQLRVCASFYGHPGVFVNPAHAAIAKARAEGFDATMLPGISAEDALLADLEIDPGVCGCCSFESTDFLLRRREFDPGSHLILWQPDVVGVAGYEGGPSRKGLTILKSELRKYYPDSHPFLVYQAAQFPACKPTIVHYALADMDRVRTEDLPPFVTFYVPPLQSDKVDHEIAAKLGIQIRR